jgi:hypothetical protein
MENKPSHKSFLCGMLRTMVCAIPFKWWLIIAGCAFGVPTSYYGVQWMMYKTVKQNLNCNTDLYLGVAQPDTTDPYQYADQIDAQVKDSLSCMQRVDPKIGTGKFIREEIKRL